MVLRNVTPNFQMINFRFLILIIYQILMRFLTYKIALKRTEIVERIKTESAANLLPKIKIEKRMIVKEANLPEATIMESAKAVAQNLLRKKRVAEIRNQNHLSRIMIRRAVTETRIEIKRKLKK